MNWRKMTDGLLVRGRNIFGETIVYTPVSDAFPRVISAIFSTAHVTVDADTKSVVSSNEPTLDVRLADLPFEPDEGDRVDVGAVAYTVTDRRDDGHGGSRLILRAI
jgi:hypothetical protein